MCKNIIKASIYTYNVLALFHSYCCYIRKINIMYFSHIFYCLLHTRLGEKIKMNYFEIVVLMLHVQSEFNRNQGKTI